MAQGLRPSQYITTFGPGAMVETPMGPHILCSTGEVLKRIDENPEIRMEDLSIRDSRLQAGLLRGDRIFKLPDGQNWPKFYHPTRRFPTWNLCVAHDTNVIHRAEAGCPRCTGKERDKSKKHEFAIRFLVACPKGHLDNVDWKFLVHSGLNRPANILACKGSDHYLWLGAGSSLSSIRIKCPSCNGDKSLGEIYATKLKCFGRRPEKYDDPYEVCDSNDAVVVQRGSFQIRLPEVVTSLTIPPLVSTLHRAMERDDIQRYLTAIKTVGLSEDSFRRGLNNQLQRNFLPPDVVQELSKASWGKIEEAIDDIDAVSTPKTLSEYLEQEHTSLRKVALTGFPPYPHDGERRSGEPISFQVESTAIRSDVQCSKDGKVFRVMPIERLRVVLVQVGFRRVDYLSPDRHLTSTRAAHPKNAGQFWVPGVEQFGEGIYIDLNPLVEGQSGWYPSSKSAKRWDSTVPSNFNTNDLVRWNALSVWWHCFSHRLINALSLHSGYSSSAIRERIYLTPNDKGEFNGGILLYTTQPGGDGTMGGLTSLSSRFNQIINMAMENIDRCSNDPLCEKAEIDSISKLGASCYSCSMVSETSCEHFNGYLDRNILLENLP
jgi:hypothetical protein